MSGKDKRVRICIVLILLNLCFIWGNSLLPAELSQAFSDGVKDILESIYPVGSAESNSDSGVLRKIAHFTEFTALGLLLCRLFRLLGRSGWKGLPLGVLAACIDETIQIVVPGRSPGILDVGIDSCGVLTGILLMQLGYALLKRIQPTRFGGKQQ